MHFFPKLMRELVKDADGGLAMKAWTTKIPEKVIEACADPDSFLEMPFDQVLYVIGAEDKEVSTKKAHQLGIKHAKNHHASEMLRRAGDLEAELASIGVRLGEQAKKDAAVVLSSATFSRKLIKTYRAKKEIIKDFASGACFCTFDSDVQIADGQANLIHEKDDLTLTTTILHKGKVYTLDHNTIQTQFKQKFESDNAEKTEMKAAILELEQMLVELEGSLKALSTKAAEIASLTAAAERAEKAQKDAGSKHAKDLAAEVDSGKAVLAAKNVEIGDLKAAAERAEKDARVSEERIVELQAELDLVKQQYGSRTDLIIIMMNSLSLLDSYRSGATEENLYEDVENPEQDAHSTLSEAGGEDLIPDLNDSDHDAADLESDHAPGGGGMIPVPHTDLDPIPNLADWAEATTEQLAKHIFDTVGLEGCRGIKVGMLRHTHMMEKLAPGLSDSRLTPPRRCFKNCRN